MKWTFTVLLAAFAVAVLDGQFADSFVASRDVPQIAYSTAPVSNRVSELNDRIRERRVQMKFEERSGYLTSVLEALKIPVESQVATFAKNSFQADLIERRNPRTLYFSDDAAVGWVRGADLLEIAVHDPRQGGIFYTIDQKATAKPEFKREDGCLACHLSWDTLGVPGFFFMSTLTVPDDPHTYASGFSSDDRRNFDSRWGGWYVTGDIGSLIHMGNVPVSNTDKPARAAARSLKSLDAEFDVTGFPTRTSDVVALMVFDHQAHMMNLITRTGWEARLAQNGDPKQTARVEEAAVDLVDYLLFVYEAPLTSPVHSTSGFADKFTARGPVDGKGRSLRQLDLNRRLLKYPCSYMIYSDAFDAMPPLAKNAVYRRLWRILSGAEHGEPYSHLTAADRAAIVEILRATKKDLPEYFKT
ncbi:MAG TPA: hypothetical protein VFP91_14745 [Vicinamibacterales bacterium]|nr:hypothetical protein [Vicinamibacterales bacterium]